jgi:uncharacterized protein YlzI (FlbEa/FlbD family)
MPRRIKVEIIGRNDYWLNAVFVEWEHEFPERRLEKVEGNLYLIEETWLEDLQRIAGQVFARVLRSPDDPGRRRLFRSLLPGGRRQ